MDCENCRHLTVVGLHDTGPRSLIVTVSFLRLPLSAVVSFIVKVYISFKRSSAWPSSDRASSSSSYFSHSDDQSERTTLLRGALCLLVGCLTSQQLASVSQGWICSDNCTCCHTEIQVADQTLYLTQSQYTDTGPTSPSTDPFTPGAWQGSHWSANFEVTGMIRPRKNHVASGIRTRDLPLSRRTP